MKSDNVIWACTFIAAWFLAAVCIISSCDARDDCRNKGGVMVRQGRYSMVCIKAEVLK